MFGLRKWWLTEICNEFYRFDDYDWWNHNNCQIINKPYKSQWILSDIQILRIYKTTSNQSENNSTGIEIFWLNKYKSIFDWIHGNLW